MPHLMNTYARLPITFTHGEGVWLWGSDGKRYMDGLAGIAVNTLGHAHPRLTAALTQQINKLMHVSNLYQIDEQEAVADQLCALSKMQEVFLCNSGCEANEAAIKLARLYGHQQGIETPAIIVMEKAFHGRTLATLSATGNRKVQAGFEPLVTGFIRVPYNDLDAINQVANNPDIAAVLVEPIQGEGGVRTLDVNYLEQLRGICDQHNWLLMLDEVQCGIGRTGKWFAHQHSSVLPDVMTLAKGMGSGVPVGACLAAGKVTGTFKPGNHGSTFGGNPLACVAVLTTLDVIQQDRLVANAATVGSLIQQELRTRLTKVAGVVDIRGQGLIIGIELDRPCGDLVNQALAQGLLISVTAENVIRLLPPLVLSSSEALQLLDKLCPLIVNFLTQDV
ncbi:MAG: aspartate aminotransferase family protein [Candidatus Nitrotoga sp.]|jgi:acetylornithine/N-succinyldiaminopimelate aminotransferase|nr:aspartate aminotransferase family protein [Candidatus Nitrotoga sp.]MDW7604597.1 aspartate aminotransferase family protein [Candidatus Nitrotoga sp.]MDW7612674.1 aspartate aminotransferase family protein [Candidatus Nitrotoga sp.]MDW7625113.1 aspartate aminotransferase family protein [Candidatus Nitrotoga sp.]